MTPRPPRHIRRMERQLRLIRGALGHFKAQARKHPVDLSGDQAATAKRFGLVPADEDRTHAHLTAPPR